MTRVDRVGTPQATVADSRNVDTGTLPEFGTGLRLALQQRGALTRPRALFSTLALLVRDERRQDDRDATPARRHVLRLAA